jgi:hypothetical protein
MVLKRLITLLIAAMLVLPASMFAFDDWDDFEDDGYGGWDEEPKEEDPFGAPDPFDPEDDLGRREDERKRDSDAAMSDLLGDEEEKKDDDLQILEPYKEEKKAVEAAPSGFKPILLIKGGFTLFGQYKHKSAPTDPKAATYGLMFGSVDEGLLGGEYMGKYVVAKGTMNLRTENPFISKSDVVNNPLKAMNYHTINSGLHHGLYELYGGIRLFDGLTIRAGKMMPEYGLIDTHQKLGMGFTNPNLTRSLSVVEGYIPETDEGFSIGYKGTFAKDHTILAGFMIGTGSVASKWWETDKTMGIYARLGYMHEYFQAAVGFQYRNDYFNETDGIKKLQNIGLGVHANVSIAGFEMPITFDYNSFGMIEISPGLKIKAAQNILLSLAPGYAVSFDSEWADKLAIAVRFDLVNGVYKGGANSTNYFMFENYTNKGMFFRIGATANFFVKEVKGVGSFAGITFLMQPASEIVKTPKEIDYGYTTLMLSAGAQY